MTEETAKKPRKEAGPVILCSVEDGHFVPVSGVAPFENGSSTDLMRWLKNNALVDGDYAFVRRICGAKVKKVQVERTLLTAD